MAHVDNNAPPPKDLVLGWDMERFTALPEGGGLLDQEAGTMQRVRVALSIYKVLSRLRNMKGAEIHKLTDGERKIIGNLQRAGYIS